MSKNRNLKYNSSQNFILKGFNSIQIGLYILLGSYFLKSTVQNFLSDSNPVMMMSIEIIEIICIAIVFFVFLLSSFAVFFSNRRTLRKLGFYIWNKPSKRHFWFFYSTMIIGIIIMKTLYAKGAIPYLLPVFLFYYGLILFFLNRKKKKQAYSIIPSISILLSLLVFLIPTYWYSTLLILGTSFIVYGIMVKK